MLQALYWRVTGVMLACYRGYIGVLQALYWCAYRGTISLFIGAVGVMIMKFSLSLYLSDIKMYC